jgi:hypothetical protein
MCCNVGSTQQLALTDLKLNEKINNYFFNQEITDYNSITIAFDNKSKKIVYYAGFVENFKNLNKCLEYRDKQLSENKNKFLLQNRDDQTNTHDNGLIQKTIRFYKINSSAAFSCDYFEEEKNSRVDYRFDVLTDKFNTWVMELNKTKTTN